MATNNLSLYAQLKQWLWRKSPLVIIGVLIAAIVFVFFWHRIVITIEPGKAGILFRRFSGTEIDNVYGEGLHIFSPLDKLYIYEVRKQVALHDFDVISNKGLTIHLSLAVRYRPEYDLLGVLHQKIGPDYLERVILPQIESVMRKELGKYTPEQIYTNEEGLLTKTILKALEEVGRNYVEVEDIIIRSIELPQEIVAAIEDKLTQEELMKSYEFRLQTAQKEADRVRIEAKGIHDHHKIISESLTEKTLQLKGIAATEKLAASYNAKIVVIGSGKNGLPLILNTDQTPTDMPIRNNQPIPLPNTNNSPNNNPTLQTQPPSTSTDKSVISTPMTQNQGQK